MKLEYDDPFAVYYAVAQQYGFSDQVDFFSMPTHASIMMRYVYSRANYSCDDGLVEKAQDVPPALGLVRSAP